VWLAILIGENRCGYFCDNNKSFSLNINVGIAYRSVELKWKRKRSGIEK
jgi:hypothetical protein